MENGRLARLTGRGCPASMTDLLVYRNETVGRQGFCKSLRTRYLMLDF